MIRKPELYERMGEASFTPGMVTALLIAFGLYILYFLLKEIPANIIDISYYSQQTYSTSTEAQQIIRSYITSPWTMTAALLISSVMLAVTMVYVRRIEKRPVSTIGLVRKGLIGNFAAGYVIGLCLLVIAVIPWLMIQKAEYNGFMPVTAVFFFAFIIQAVSSEVFFRGFMLSSLSVKGRFISAALITSAFYALLHIWDRGITPIYILDLFVSGILYAFYTLRTGSLWGAVGMHAAWNFALGLVSPVIWGNLVTDYSAFKAGLLSESQRPEADLFYLGFIGLEIVAVAIVLFAGKNKLAVKISEERLMYLNALKTARRSLKGLRGEDGRPLLRRALRVADKIEEEPVKAAALLYAACSGGNVSSDELKGRGFSESVLGAVEELVVTPKGMVYQNVKNPAALSVVVAGVDYDDEHASGRRAKHKNRKALINCPLLRREIDSVYCMSVVQSINNGTDGDVFDIRICKSCPNRSI